MIVVGVPCLIDGTSLSILPILSQTTTERTMEADRLLNEGIKKLANMEANQADSILTLFQKALTIYQEEKDKNGEGQAFKNLGIFYYQLQDYSQALNYTQQALKIAQEIKDFDLETRALTNEGLIYYSQKTYPLAIRSYEEGLSILQKINSPELESKLNHNLANAYKDSKNFSQAITHYEKALVLARKINSLPAQYLILDSLSEVHKNLGNNSQANEYSQQAFEILRQIETNKMNNLPKQEIKGIIVPSRYKIFLEGKIDDKPFDVISGTLEIQPASEGDPNPFLVALYMDKVKPEELKIGSLFWQSYSPGHPQEKEHFSRISISNNQVSMEINPSEGFRSDVTWFIQGLLGENLQQLQQELDQIQEQINQVLEEQGQPRTETGSYKIPNKPTFAGVVPKSGLLTFSIQNNQILGTIDASGISSDGKQSRYQAKFTGQLIEEQSKNNDVQTSLKKDDLNGKPMIEASNKKNPLCSFFDKFLAKTTKVSAKDDFIKKKSNALFSLSGIKEPQFKSLQGAWWGTENLSEIFLEANWVFLDDNTFIFIPPVNANVRKDLFPLLGNYSNVNNTLKIRGEQSSSGTATSLDGTIKLQGKQAFLDVIYVVTSMDSQRIVRVSQTLLKNNKNITYKLPKTEIEGIKIPSSFKISLQGETNGKSFGQLSGILKIKPNDLSNNSHPFIVTLKTDARKKNGSISWITQGALSFANSQITIDNHQVTLQLKPSSTIFSDLNWWTLPSSQSNELNNSLLIFTGTEGELTFTINNNKISGTIKGTGNSSGFYSSNYQATFTGETETLPPSFQGVWQEKSPKDFQKITLKQEAEKVSGTYTGNGGGKIEGFVTGNRLDFTWKGLDKRQGNGFLRAVSSGRTLTGIWENVNSSTQKKSFLAERTKDSYRNLEIAKELAQDKWYLKDWGADLVLEGRCEQALSPLETALKLYEKERQNLQNDITTTYSYLLDETNIIRNLTYCYFQLQDYQSLIASLDNSLEVRKTMIQTQYLSLPIGQQAIDIRQALATPVENWRKRLTEDADKIIALDKAQPFLQKLTTYLVELDAQEEALLASELSRARAFADLLEKQVSSSTLKRVISANPPTIKQIKKIAKEQNATLVEYWVTKGDLNTSNEKQNQKPKVYIWVIQPEGKINFRSVDLTFSNQSLNQIVAETRKFMGLGEATRGNAIESTFKLGDLVRLKTDPLEYVREVVRVSPDGNSITVRFANAPNAPIRDVLARELEKVASGTNKRLQQLYKLLIDPISQFLPTNPEAHVIFIPHQELFLLPFPALQDKQEKYLIDNHTILTSPAIQVLDSTHHRRQQITGKAQESVIIGNPSPMPGNFAPIQGSEEEAKTVAQQLKVKPLIGTEATEKNVREKLSQARLIHFATHGTFDNENPLQGLIALAPSGNEYNGMFTAEKILNLGYLLNAELVVLSACDTGRGKISGDGVIGLSRSWMIAGVPSIIVSLWQVPDEKATPLLMEKFYQEHTQKNSNKAQALRKAMLETKTQHPEPKNWAAFTLIGEAK
ncbi:CHAT domain-containing protein [Aphanothece sacrum]|uniref:CHAT domain-containing protein n=1 Tax=Aphanothece sacrum TaxID=1122 RepID=UPI0015628A6F|nr:CHAT domain-containing tetratricopeptide repeat protein [Aphanothece sacrum]